ncbi:P-loop containing nucleoside triphosphate hydrolase protein [Panaeolus papilionaceus]|nr:P-loop containing nucleoside triphosphate hydrolase protein [Panaeolus papilionaceus]
MFARVARACAAKSPRMVGSIAPRFPGLLASRSGTVFSSTYPYDNITLYIFTVLSIPQRTIPILHFRNAATAANLVEKLLPELEEEAVPKDPSTSFQNLKGVISDRTLRAITIAPFHHTHMSSVQHEILPMLPDLSNPFDPENPDAVRDLLVKAKTGTGKTLAFLVPAIEARIRDIETNAKQAVQDSGLEPSRRNLAQAASRYATENVGTLIISPTRELATQIALEASNLTAHHEGFYVQVLLGGASKYRQIQDWRNRKDIVVATPGRVLDLLNSEPAFAKALKSTKVLILDEADTLLDMGFRPDIERLDRYLPETPQRQTFLFSATVSSKVKEIANFFTARNHRFVDCVPVDDSPVHDHIPQYHTVVDPAEVLQQTVKLIAHDQLIAKSGEGGHKKSKIVLFLSTTKMVSVFTEFLRDMTASGVLPCGRRIAIYEMHSGLAMPKRVAVSKAFRAEGIESSHSRGRSAEASILVTSDVSARGVDYPGVSRVVQVGVPTNGDVYVHRVGRTGRGSDKHGRADLLVMPFEEPFIRSRLQRRGVKINPLTTPTLDAEIKELEEKAVASKAGAGKSQPSVLEDITDLVTMTADKLDYDLMSSAFLAQLGFYFGHSGDHNTRIEDVMRGVEEMFIGMGVKKEELPRLSGALRQRLASVGTRSTMRGRDSVRRTDFRGRRDDQRREWGVDNPWNKRTSRSYEGGGERRSSSYGRDFTEGGEERRTPIWGREPREQRSFGEEREWSKPKSWGKAPGEERRPRSYRDGAQRSFRRSSRDEF